MKAIVAVTGNLGKSTFSYFLGERLSKKNKVTIISTDTDKSMYRCLFPKGKKNAKSLGKLLADPVLTIKDISENANILNDNLLYISYAKGERKDFFPEITTVNCTRLYTILAEISDIIIVDTSNHDFDKFILANPNTKIISVTTCDIRGNHYRLVHGNDFINVLWSSSKFNSYSDVIATFGDKPFELPYIKALTNLYVGEDITDIYLNKKYTQEIEKISNLFETE